MKTRLLLGTLLANLLFLPGLLAQEGEPITCRILYLNAPAGAPKTAYLHDGQGGQEVALPGMNFSPVYEVPGTTTELVFLPGAPAEGEEIPARAPRVTLPAGRDFYLLLTTDAENSVLPLAVHPAAADFDQFAAGGMLWFNLTGVAVAGEVGGEKLTLKPQSRFLLASPREGKGSYPVNLAYREKADAPIYPICETSWTHDPRMRKVAFIFQEKGRRAPRVLAFNDFRPE
ncbi:hypothetical protein [Roseibacillus ishigakijimensis]|uniref:DUF4397 domain-containing protein n=1 Tax=Roseibacillus ishigakijimensis TaxID=454146 RepID=A0A934VNS1_9BACT|nr:hypothetical protein [Roseibacillus ishigakijimensis]MBK1835325.1 hypothetical protein [Roseibacillus ishigakijimensis]